MSDTSDSLPQVDLSQHESENEIPLELRILIGKLQNNYPFFSDMEDEEVVHFLKLCSQQSFNEGDEIFKERESASHFFLVVSGEVSITVGQKEIARLKQGSVFGEMAVLEDVMRAATATSAMPSVIFSIGRDILSSKMPRFAYKVTLSIARQLSEKLREANGTINKLQEQLEKAAAVIKSDEE